MSRALMLSLGQTPLTLERIAEVARRNEAVELAPEARRRMAASRAVVESVLAAGDDAPAVYGVNTGFGALAEVRIDDTQIRDLQRNLVRSHSAGVGAPLPRDAVRGMMLLRA